MHRKFFFPLAAFLCSAVLVATSFGCGRDAISIPQRTTVDCSSDLDCPVGFVCNDAECVADDGDCVDGQRRCNGNDPQECRNGVWSGAIPGSCSRCEDGRCIGPELPDLVVVIDEVGFTTPVSSVDLTWTVANIGNASLPSSSCSLRVLEEGGGGAVDQLTEIPTTSLDPGEGETIAFVVADVTGFPAPFFRLEVDCDPDRLIEEQREDNNRARTEPIPLPDGAPALDVVVDPATREVELGEILPVSVTVRHVQGGALGGDLRVFVRLGVFTVTAELRGVSSEVGWTRILEVPIEIGPDDFEAGFGYGLAARVERVGDPTLQWRGDGGDVFVLAGPECADDGFEPNDSQDTATRLMSGASLISDLALCRDNTDWYFICPNDHQLLAVSAFEDPGSRVDLELYTEAGLWQSTVALGAPQTNVYYGPTAGCYWIHVLPSTPADRHEYTLQVGESPILPCRANGNEQQCNGIVGCRFLQPGCGPNPITPGGCHRYQPCTSDDECLEGETCQETTWDPCYNQDCDACGATEDLCLPELIAGPDLVPSNATVIPLQLQPGEAFVLDYTTRNVGTASTSGHRDVVRLVSANSSVLIGPPSGQSGFGAGEERTTTRGLVIPDGTAPGTYEVEVGVDIDDSVLESNELNNTTRTAVAVLDDDCPPDALEPNNPGDPVPEIDFDTYAGLLLCEGGDPLDQYEVCPDSPAEVIVTVDFGSLVPARLTLSPDGDEPVVANVGVDGRATVAANVAGCATFTVELTGSADVLEYTMNVEANPLTPCDGAPTQQACDALGCFWFTPPMPMCPGVPLLSPICRAFDDMCDDTTSCPIGTSCQTVTVEPWLDDRVCQEDIALCLPDECPNIGEPDDAGGTERDLATWSDELTIGDLCPAMDADSFVFDLADGEVATIVVQQLGTSEELTVLAFEQDSMMPNLAIQVGTNPVLVVTGEGDHEWLMVVTRQKGGPRSVLYRASLAIE